jgi:hypothetical protein
VEPETRHATHFVSNLLSGIVSDWKDPLSGDTSQARQVLRKLLNGRLKFNPKLDEAGMPYYEFSGTGILDPLIAGSVSGTGNGPSDRPFNDLKRWWPQGEQTDEADPPGRLPLDRPPHLRGAAQEGRLAA